MSDQQPGDQHKFNSYYCACIHCCCHNRVASPFNEICGKCKLKCYPPPQPRPRPSATGMLVPSEWEWEWGLEKENGKKKEEEEEEKREGGTGAGSEIRLETGFWSSLGLDVPLPTAAHFRPEGPKSVERSVLRSGIRYKCLCKMCGCKELFRYKAAYCWKCSIECVEGEDKGKGKDGEEGREGNKGGNGGGSGLVPEMSGAL
ncbi:hypothetical protein MFIFM68171_10479 [Madurella fahalii]|uniref:Cysteine-rich DPF motif domain-containing protein 1 n=1 Tax=Madurella fahalii TaxID=1157608 RepID=A0ABQ0GRB0_9PEZI